MEIEITFIVIAAFFAGMIDAIVGGGGLILIPSLFAAFPNTAVATLFGSNKIASICGTSLAAWQYSRKITFNWSILKLILVLAAIGSGLGAWLLTKVSGEILRLFLPFILSFILVYTLWKKDLGLVHAPKFTATKEKYIGGICAFIIGIYDGFFGPGTGSFLIFIWVKIIGYDFLRASAHAKLINLTTNFAAIVIFFHNGNIWWKIAILMAIANIAGSWYGAIMAFKYGVKFVRYAFILIVSALIIKSATPLFFK